MKDVYEIVTWPEYQDYMMEDGFADNSCLITDDRFVYKYGSSAFFINLTWKNKIDKKKFNLSVCDEKDDMV